MSSPGSCLPRRPFGHPPPRDDSHAVHRLAAEKDILGDAQFRRDADADGTMPMLAAQRVTGGAEMDRLPVDTHGPRMAATERRR